MITVASHVTITSHVTTCISKYKSLFPDQVTNDNNTLHYKPLNELYHSSYQKSKKNSPRIKMGHWHTLMSKYAKKKVIIILSLYAQFMLSDAE